MYVTQYYHFLHCKLVSNSFISEGVVCFCFMFVIDFFERQTEHLAHICILYFSFYTCIHCYVNFNYNWIKVLRLCKHHVLSCVHTFTLSVYRHELFIIYSYWLICKSSQSLCIRITDINIREQDFDEVVES